MSSIVVSLDLKNKTGAFAPGSTVDGSVTIHNAEGSWTASHAELLLFWRTEGRGDTDEGVAAGVNLAEQSTQMPGSFTRDFSLTLPQLPWTYHGKLLKIRWFLGAYMKGKPGGNSEQEICLSVHGNEAERLRLQASNQDVE
jgi:hypothetical protein